jgi:hypothetical protein
LKGIYSSTSGEEKKDRCYHREGNRQTEKQETEKQEIEKQEIEMKMKN